MAALPQTPSGCPLLLTSGWNAAINGRSSTNAKRMPASSYVRLERGHEWPLFHKRQADAFCVAQRTIPVDDRCMRFIAPWTTSCS